MSKKRDILEDSGDDSEHDDDDNGFKVNEDYAKKYEEWRSKEVYQQLKDKYGDVTAKSDDEEEGGDDESSSETEDSDAEELTEEVEKEFYRTLASLKAKDPKIYDTNTKFFDSEEKGETPEKKKEKKKKEEKFTVHDMEKKVLLEKGGIYEDDDVENIIEQPQDKTYVEEVAGIKDSLKAALQDSSDEESDDDNSGLLKKRQKTATEKATEEAEYKAWLAGQKQTLSDQNLEKDMSGLKTFWNKEDLDEDESFLKDYLLNKRYKDPDKETDTGEIPTYDEIINDLSDEEEQLQKEAEFEQKFNFRFEEPDQEFIKRYPRTIKDSLRQKDEKRKKKRQEVEERKKQEKQQKMEEIKIMKSIKKKEILEKLERLKKITGNNDMALGEEDIDGDFDPAAYDKKMQEIWNNMDPNIVETEKPTFSDLEDDEQYGEDMAIENWDGWEGVEYQGDENDYAEGGIGGDDFNMDCDYDPALAMQQELINNQRGRKKGRKKSKFRQALEQSQDKPVFDPNDKTFESYVDEYYKLDCEDIIADIPCRFKYRNVEANDFGLNPDEIILSEDKELNQWCSLKKAVQYRSQDEEIRDINAFQSKRNDYNYKKKILRSLYNPQEETPDSEITQKKKKKRKKNKKRMFSETDIGQDDDENKNSKIAKLDTSTTNKICDNATNGEEAISNKTVQINVTNDNATADNANSDKIKKKRKKKNKPSQKDQQSSNENKKENVQSQPKQNPPSANKNPPMDKKQNPPNKQEQNQSTTTTNLPLKHQNKYKKNKPNTKFNTVAESRLLAYGLNPNKIEKEKKKDELYRNPKS